MNMPPEKIAAYFLYFSVMAFAGRIIETACRSRNEKNCQPGLFVRAVSSGLRVLSGN
jgi:hypothetical protein